MAAIAVEQNRTVLTRDIGLLKHKVIQHGYWLRSQHPEEQLIEVIRRYSLGNRIQPFSRCLTCNGGLQVIPKVAIHQNLPPLTKEYFQEFYQCRGCRKLYWKGSHYLKMQKLVAKIRLLAC